MRKLYTPTIDVGTTINLKTNPIRRNNLINYNGFKLDITKD